MSAHQIWVLTALAEVPMKVLTLRFCLSALNSNLELTRFCGHLIL